MFLFQGLVSGFKTSKKISVFLGPHSEIGNSGCLDNESDSVLGSFMALHCNTFAFIISYYFKLLSLGSQRTCLRRIFDGILVCCLYILQKRPFG